VRWRRVDNPDVIDQRGRGGGGFPLPIPTGRGGAVGGGLGLVVLLVVLGLQMCAGGGSSFNLGPAFEVDAQAPGQPAGLPSAEETEAEGISRYVFTDAQNTWDATFQRAGQQYDNAQMVLYSGGVNTACGSASSAVGPFYCPADRRIYLDLSFYRDMQERLGAGGDFAWAYVIAHEMGHHVQQELGTEAEVRSRQQENPDDRNELSVRLELQADCYAGVWANTVFSQGILEEGDLEEAFGAAEAVGDDRLQQRATGTVNPDSFTHGSSEQRRSWFEEGYESGDAGTCDTFSPDEV
jgi:predicted metalloprotease